LKGKRCTCSSADDRRRKFDVQVFIVKIPTCGIDTSTGVIVIHGLQLFKVGRDEDEVWFISDICALQDRRECIVSRGGGSALPVPRKREQERPCARVNLR
jgi:hypothetical protein